MRLWVLIAWLVVVLAAPVRAETIALLPLDGEKRLEIYGQPVAVELARALRAADVDVVVVGANMAVPDGARLIVDGTIKAGKGKEITLSIRVRDPRDGTVLEMLPAPATSLDKLDKAAADLSARVVPSVKSHLDALAKAAAAAAVPRRPDDNQLPPPPPAPVAPEVVVSVSWPVEYDHARARLHYALRSELPDWLRRQRRAMRLVTGDKLARKRAPQTVAEASGEAGIAFEVLTFHVDTGDVPMARARVRVRISDRSEVVFERIVRTDTVVGDKGSSPDAMAERTAREVLAIVRAHVRRAIRTWR